MTLLATAIPVVDRINILDQKLDSDWNYIDTKFI